jgi:hypothetical protein
MGLPPRKVGALSAYVRVLDTQTGVVTDELQLRSAYTPVDGDQCASPWLEKRTLWQPTRAAVFRVDLDGWIAEESLSHPIFHDVHSVAPGLDGWLVTCTGHETVVEIDHAGQIHHRWSFASKATDRDHRLLPHDEFKPHASHPNRAFLIDGRRWVTLMGTQRLRCLDDGREVYIQAGPPHDGVLREGLLWLTTTNGHVLGLDPLTFDERVHLDVNAMLPGAGLPGWCRGVEVVGDRVWVGMTMFRRSRWREAARVAVRGRSGRKQPTRVIELNWRTSQVNGAWSVGRGGAGSIYGITAWPT